ncbi:SNF2-related protein [Streptomyces sp. NPDC007355]|uniref:SNF2-related protein n=1 Tax=Streptomyces sp. NPDC007355 TaxID=3364778 RepID=UPI0036C8AD92
MGGRPQLADDVRHSGASSGADVRHPWHERARGAVLEGRFDAGIVSEAERLARAGQLTRADLRMLLLVTDDHPGWLPARRLAVEGLEGTPEVPQQVLTAHAQIESWPPLTYDESAEHQANGHVLHTAAVRIGPAGAQVTGPARSAPTAALARRSAADALLRRLAGTEGPAGRAGGARLTVPGMGTEAFETLLHARVATAEPGEALTAEVARRAAAARLRHRDIQFLLFGARGPAWREPRLCALRVAARMQSAAATLLRRHAEERGAEALHTVVPSEEGFTCRWTWEGGAGAEPGDGRAAVDGAGLRVDGRAVDGVGGSVHGRTGDGQAVDEAGAVGHGRTGEGVGGSVHGRTGDGKAVDEAGAVGHGRARDGQAVGEAGASGRGRTGDGVGGSVHGRTVHHADAAVHSRAVDHAAVPVHRRAVQGAERSARDRRQAVHLGAVALLAELTGLPEPEVERTPDDAGGRPAARIQPVPEGQDPVKYLNKYTQLDLISKPESTFTAAPKSVVCSYTCAHVRTGAEVRVSCRARTRGEARRAAASALMAELVAVDAEHSPPARPADTARDPVAVQLPTAGDTARVPAAAPPPRAAHPSRDPAAVPLPSAAALPRPRPVPSPASGVVGSGGRGAGRPSPAPVSRVPVADVVRETLAAGCAVTFLPSEGGGEPAGLLLHRADGAPMPDAELPAPLSVARRRLLAAPGSAPVPVVGWRVPLDRAVPVLLRRDRAAGWHPTAAGWEEAARLGLRAVAAGLVRPALSVDGVDRWLVGPLPVTLAREVEELSRRTAPHPVAETSPGARETVPAFLDAVADMMLRPPAAALFGAGPFLGPTGRPLPEDDVERVRPWLDMVEDRLDSGPPPGLFVEFAAPSDEDAVAGRLTGRLLVAVDPSRPDHEVAAALLGTGRVGEAGVESYHLRERVRRRLERSVRRCGVLSGLLAAPGRLVADAAGIARLLEAETDLAAEGLVIRWPPGLRDLLSAHTVVGAETGTGTEGSGRADAVPGSGAADGAPRFSLQALLDFRWQLALGGDVLSEAEMDELAEAARPLVRVRGRWVLLDPLTVARVRRREIGRLAGIDALTAALTGTVDVDGRTVPCRAGGDLAGVVDVLRRGEHAVPVPAPAGLAAVLRGYQERALSWLSHTGGTGFGAVLADDMGLGKTLTAIAYTLHRYENGRRGPVLVVCPSSLVTNWEREYRRFAPGLDVTVYHGSRRSLDAAGDRTVVLTTYGVLRRDTALAERRWDLVIADEAQHAKNHASSTARRLHALTSMTRLALTGTPVENNLSELWTLLDWVNPGLFGPLKAFRSRYAAAAERDPDGPAARALARLVAPFLLRRRKTDPGVAPELPAKVEARRIVELTAEQVALYEAVVRETMEQLADAPSLARSGLVFKLITALKQITNHPAHYWGEEHPGRARAGEFTARSAKLEALAELVGTITGRGEAALVFTSYVTMGRLLTEHLTHLGHRPLFLHGGLDARRRQELVDAFQAGRSPLFVLSVKAGGTGLTLTRASHVVHFDRSWNAAVEDQASDRAHRIGQRQTVTVHRLITRGTIEDRIDQLLTHKRSLQDTVLGSGDTGLARLSDRDLADLVRLGGSR